MKKASEYIEEFKNDQHNDLLADVYLDESLLAYEKERYIKALERFIELYKDQDVTLFSAAGRSEVSGNHTDHQHGRVLAASVNLDTIAVVAENKDGDIEVVSDGFNIAPVSLNELDVKDEEAGSSEALIRGVAAGFKKDGYNIGGFKAFMTSNVMAGAGLSSSASFEVMIGTILSGLYNADQVDAVEIAKIAQMAENVYFKKPCGLMDQCACSVGGLISIDFKDPSKPVVHPVDADFSKFGYSLCITDTKGDHADLTDEYAAIPEEMKKVAAYFGKEVLEQVDEKEFYASLMELRNHVSDRAILRAIHFFEENKRVPEIVKALEEGDFEGFKAGIQASGNSSYKYLQNVYASNDASHQAISLGLALSELILQDKGVCRVHGGGFAGTIQAFVPNELVAEYKEGLESLFGKDSVHVLKVTKYGGKHLL
jgi:galactokinase